MIMRLPSQEAQQDTIQLKNIPVRDSVTLKSDSAALLITIEPKDSIPHRIKILSRQPVVKITDTISVCSRNSIEDITFYDSGNLASRIESGRVDNFPFLFIAKNREIQAEEKTMLIKHLRTGEKIPLRSLHDDWILLIMLFVTFLFSIIRKSSDNMFQGPERFFLFRGINNTSSRDTGGLFTWVSTIKNLVSFLILGLFGYSAASFFNIIPAPVSGIIFWIISVFIIIGAATIRHLVCLATGAVSGEREVFAEYLNGIYQFYRFSALFIFIITILISYTTLFPVKSYFIAGVIVLSILYLIRVIRLFIIFINKNISLFYLILYLCALEILPVVISVKYISGLA